ncbi:hypothetical protein DL237_14875 [Pseudooceanicola sediminis]|uniref:Uncharacterized protein n=1 Tax=Pseudooceanicola sediminis TaxID=2211117 RepID=A0A399IXQ1_9RHOB|nr:hypothetical protein [Pseudooceanicola sediminis]RII37953.1 hypothetical protein DL237_14875 [Pseudooceanicola sediminis]|tara:strand:+ start:17703 stop:18086 length:384 start_codon:yes stop_codon:yes gene_type:complete
MPRNVWHRLREAEAVTVTRRLPVQFDLEARTEVATTGPVSLTRVAHQVRQDMWRGLQGVRGFSPAVRVELRTGGVCIIAGGRIDGAAPTEATLHRLQRLLESRAHQGRWLRHAALDPSARERGCACT